MTAGLRWKTKGGILKILHAAFLTVKFLKITKHSTKVAIYMTPALYLRSNLHLFILELDCHSHYELNGDPAKIDQLQYGRLFPPWNKKIEIAIKTF